MRAYNELVQELDSGGARYSQDLSEVDLSDLENLKVRVNDPAGDVLVQLGSSDFLKRYRTYVSHVRDWRQQFQKLESVNLRYDNQVIVNPDMEGKPKQSALSASAARAAAAAGVKPAALITHINPRDRALPKPAFELTEKKLESASTKKPTPRARVRKTRPIKVASSKKAKPSASAPKVATTAHAAARKPITRKQPLPSATAHPSIPKPSAAIAKQQPNGSSD
jgi:cell division protein FtsQ